MVPHPPATTTHEVTIPRWAPKRPQFPEFENERVQLIAPTFELEQRIQDSLNRGIQLLKYEISGELVRQTVIATDQTGYVMQLIPRPHALSYGMAYTDTINSGDVVEEVVGALNAVGFGAMNAIRHGAMNVAGEEVLMITALEFMLGYPIVSLPDDCPIDRLIVHMYYRDDDASFKYMANLLLGLCYDGLMLKFHERTGEIRPFLKVNRFCVEYEGKLWNEEDLIRLLLSHMQPNELHFQLPRTLDYARRLNFTRTWTSSGFMTAKKLHIEDGFYINLKSNTWMMFDEIRVTLNSLTSTHLRKMLKEWRARETFVSSRVRVRKSNWNSARLRSFFDEFPDDRVTIRGPSFIYEDGIRVELHGIDIVFVAVDADKPFTDWARLFLAY